MLSSPRCGGEPSALPAGVVAEAVREASARQQAPETELQTIVELAVASGVFDAASITVFPANSTPASIASTGEIAPPADELQYQLLDGPCFEAVLKDELLVIEDVAADGRWPQWAAKAVEIPVRSAVSVHLFVGNGLQGSLGALTLYAAQPRTFTAADLETAKVLGAHASACLARASVVDNLNRAITSRTVIGQAQGILMERFKLTSEQAFNYLTAYSQNHNTKLQALAEELTSTGTLPGLLKAPPTAGL